jgi:hypothetical protein
MVIKQDPDPELKTKISVIVSVSVGYHDRVAVMTKNNLGRDLKRVMTQKKI